MAGNVYNITTFDYPAAAETFGGGINDAGTVTGGYVPPSGPAIPSFLLSNGTYSVFSVTGSVLFTSDFAINNSGQSVGDYQTTSGALHGFIRSAAGVITTFNYPGKSGTTGAYGINNAGLVVGTYGVGTSTPGGFLKNGSTYTAIKDPQNTSYTNVFGINDSGQIVGNYLDNPTNDLDGFIRSSDGTQYLNFMGPAPPGLTQYDTYALDINNAGVVVGYTSDQAETQGVGYIRYTDGSFQTFTVPGAAITFVSGINSYDALSGYYTDTNGVSHGFFATVAVPESGAGILAGLGLALVVCGYRRSKRRAPGHRGDGGARPSARRAEFGHFGEEQKRQIPGSADGHAVCAREFWTLPS